MVIQCDKCQTKFRLDDSKVTGKGIKVRCTKCQNVFVVAPPEAQPETLSAAPDAAKECVAPPSPSQGEMSFSGGFQAPPDKDFPPTKTFEGKPGQAPASSAEEKKDEGGFSFGTGFGFQAGDEAGKKADEDAQSEGFGAKDWSFDAPTPGGEEQFQGFGQADEGRISGGMNLKAGAAKDEPKEKPQAAVPEKKEGLRLGRPPISQPQPIPASEDWGIKPAEPDDKGGLTLKPEAKTQTAHPGPTEPEATPKKSIGELTDEEFSAALSKDEKAAPKATAPAASRKKPLLLLLVAAIIAGLGGAAYFSGVLDILNAPTTQTAGQNNVVIENMNGYFFDGKNIGRVFVVEARLKNISGANVGARNIKAVIYDAKGAVLATAPGMIISTQDVAKLTKDDLAKQAKTSLTAITAKGSIPVVAVFTAPPAGMAEFGIEFTL